jgi:hypothetical protein
MIAVVEVSMLVNPADIAARPPVRPPDMPSRLGRGMLVDPPPEEEEVVGNPPPAWPI